MRLRARASRDITVLIEISVTSAISPVTELLDLAEQHRPAAVVLVEDVEAIERTHSIELDTETPETALIAEEGATLLATAIATLSAPLRETLRR